MTLQVLAVSSVRWNVPQGTVAMEYIGTTVETHASGVWEGSFGEDLWSLELLFAKNVSQEVGATASATMKETAVTFAIRKAATLFQQLR